jgi:hypothetical protein
MSEAVCGSKARISPSPLIGLRKNEGASSVDFQLTAEQQQIRETILKLCAQFGDMRTYQINSAQDAIQ